MSHHHDPTEELGSGAVTRRDLLRTGGALAATLSIPSFVLSACGSGGATGTRAEKLTWGLNAELKKLNQYEQTDVATITVLSLALEGLLTLDSKLKLQPALAESWTQPDAKTYVYKLRDGVKFWDGSPLTAEDIVFSMSRHMDPEVASVQSSFYASVKSIEASGPLEVTVKLKEPDSLFQYVPAIHTRYVVKKSFLEAKGKSLGSQSALTMGTGPYKIQSFTDQGVQLVRNEQYWGVKPPVRQLTINSIPDASTRLIAMRSQQIDGAFEISPIKRWKAIRGVKVESAPAFKVATIGLDLHTEPFDDVHVRRAFAHAVDKAGAVKAILSGAGRPAVTIPDPELWGDVLAPDAVKQAYAKLPTYEFDLEKARAELAQSKVPNGFTTKVEIASDLYPNMVLLAQTLKENLKQIGVTLNVKEIPSSQWANTIYGHKNLGIQMLELNTDYPDPSNNPYLLLPSKFAKANAFNMANYKNAKVDELLDLQQRSTNKEERAKALLEALRIAAQDTPYIPVWWSQAGVALRQPNDYKGFNGFYRVEPWAQNLAS